MFDFDQTLFKLNVNWAEAKETEYKRYHLEMMATKDRKFSKKVIKLIKKLHKDYYLSIFSMNYKQPIIEVIINSGLSHYMSVEARNTVNKQKPDPEGLFNIYWKYSGSFDPHEIVMVGDSWYDVHAAKNFKCRSIILETDHTPEGADHYIKDLKELPDLLERIY